MSDLSAGILNFDGGALLQQTLQSLYDTTGGLALEPLVVDNGSSDGSLEVVDDAGLLVVPLDVDALAGAMRRVLADDELRRQMRAKGLERAKQFTWEETARRTLQVYEEAVQVGYGAAS
jgi:glycosyltransferase involved in cell wall biosynthesis